MAITTDTAVVQLAGRDFVVRRIPMARVLQLDTVLSGILQNVANIDVQKPEDAQTVLKQMLAFPHELLALFIKDLPRDIFEDAENGVTFPEFLEALQTAIKLNRLDTLKNFLSPLMRTFLAQGSPLKSAN
jgi:hypothetical protein